LGSKTVLVTGGTGLIGSRLIQKLTRYEPAKIISIARGVTPPFALSDGVDYLTSDIRDAQTLNEIFTEVQPDVVFHVAADKYNHDAEFRARHTLTTNIAGMQNVISAAENSGVCHFIYASTGKAARPFSPDIYASSKKTGEWLLSRVAEQGDMSCSAVRFTHVVDDSNVRRKIHEQIDVGGPVKLQSPETSMYIQSVCESADLLLNAAAESDIGPLTLQAIRDLEMPINITDLGLGAIAKSERLVPIYFCGAQKGYEDKPWPGLFDPMTAGDVTPLFCSLEASQAFPSAACPQVDRFPLQIGVTAALEQSLSDLLQACGSTESNQSLRSYAQKVGWAMLEARLGRMPRNHLARAACQAAKITRDFELTEEHTRTNNYITTAFQARNM
jgi:nucleoside-diphosphate-sugar epimerase